MGTASQRETAVPLSGALVFAFVEPGVLLFSLRQVGARGVILSSPWRLSLSMVLLRRQKEVENVK